MSQSTITAKFTLAKETQGSYQFREVDENGQPYGSPNAPGCKIGGLYLRKSVLNGTRPKDITVTVTVS